MKTKSKIRGHIMRSAAYAALLLCIIVGLSSAFNLPGKCPGLSRFILPGGIKSAAQIKTLTFSDRVAYQRAIEEVYWRHRTWSAENGIEKPSLDKVMSQAQIEKKVEIYLRDSQALESYWQKPITPEQLQAEMDRMARHTRQPEVLREIFAALGNDPYIIAECLARPALADRLVRNFYAHDERFHGDLKRRADAELAAHCSVKQMKQTTGTYSEIEWVKSEDDQGRARTPLRAAGRTEDKNDEWIVGQAPRLPSPELAGEAPALQKQEKPNALKLDSTEWNDNVQKLALAFSGAKSGRARPKPPRGGEGVPTTRGDEPNADPWAQIQTGKLSSLQEDNDRYYATAVISKSKERLKLATIAWLKQPFDSWRARAETQLPVTMAAPITADYTFPVIGSPSVQCTVDTWTPTNLGPEARDGHTAVWTGSEMIVWGGLGSNTYLTTGTRYDPATDSWTPTNTTNAPEARSFHTAVWTGTQMIVWGGYGNSGYENTGGRYNPATDSWTATSTTSAPVAREDHTAVWTGSQMIVWGGDDSGPTYLNTGGRYNPTTDSWTATSTTNAPEGRSYHTAIWTGSQMIVWGGYFYDGVDHYLNTGGRYDPITDSWTATSTASAPETRAGHTAVWTGSEMIVWGGVDGAYLNGGGRYDPTTDSWTATSITNAPLARDGHTAIWTGSEMIVWGGYGDTGYENTGGRYNPATDSWTATSITNAPVAREYHTAVWTGSQMIVWGGQFFDGVNFQYLNTGGRYDPTIDSWTATSVPSAPEGRDFHTAVWTGSEMIVWGGFDGNFDSNTGARYDPATDTWTPTSITNAPLARDGHTAVWTGSSMIVWGGTVANTGGRYDPATDSWTPTSTTNAPEARSLHTAVWTGSQMIVWGGQNNSGTYLNTGGRYDPAMDSWIATSTTNAPEGRIYHTAVWTGTQMIVWGGWNGSSDVNSGGRYNPNTDSWTATSTTNAPEARSLHTAVWTGSQMIVWGGQNNSATRVNTGGRYNPATDSWIATSTTNAPEGRIDHTAVWTGSERLSGADSPTAPMLTPAGATTPLRTVGQQPALPTRPEPDTSIPPSGPAVR